MTIESKIKILKDIEDKCIIYNILCITPTEKKNETKTFFL